MKMKMIFRSKYKNIKDSIKKKLLEKDKKICNSRVKYEWKSYAAKDANRFGYRKYEIYCCRNCSYWHIRKKV
jgi:hypothetical protein